MTISLNVPLSEGGGKQLKMQPRRWNILTFWIATQQITLGRIDVLKLQHEIAHLSYKHSASYVRIISWKTALIFEDKLSLS